MQCKSLWIKASAKCINVNVKVVVLLSVGLWLVLCTSLSWICSELSLSCITQMFSLTWACSCGLSLPDGCLLTGTLNQYPPALLSASELTMSLSLSSIFSLLVCLTVFFCLSGLLGPGVVVGTSTGKSFTSSNRFRCNVLVFPRSLFSGCITYTGLSDTCSFTTYTAFSQ